MNRRRERGAGKTQVVELLRETADVVEGDEKQITSSGTGSLGVDDRLESQLRWPTLWKWRQDTIPLLIVIQKLRCAPLDLYFRFTDFLGEELFFLCFLPFCCWVLGERISLHEACLTALAIGGGNYFKNIYCIDRPQHPRLWLPPGGQKKDHGFPSTHSMSSLAVPWYLVVALYLERPAPEAVSLSVAISIAAWWTISIVLGRLYLGYHSPLDVSAGLLFGSGMLFTFYFVLRHLIDAWILYGAAYGQMLTMLGGASIMWFHPRPKDPTPAIPESGLVFGVSAGAVAGFIYRTHGELPSFVGPIMEDIDPESWLAFVRATPLLFHLGRVLLGGVVIGLIRIAAKATFQKVMALYMVFGTNKALAPQQANTAVKFMMYFVVSYSVIVIAPVLFRWVGLHSEIDLRPYDPTTQ